MNELMTKAEAQAAERDARAFLEALASDPELRKEATSKLAFFEDVPWKNAFQAMALGAGMSAAGVAVSDLYRSVKDSLGKSRAYKAMVDNNPQLSDHDARRVQSAFNTLHRFNPDYAQDPALAGQFVSDMLGMERTDVASVNALVQARKNLADSQGSPAIDPMRWMTMGQAFMGSPSDRLKNLKAQEELSAMRRGG